MKRIAIIDGHPDPSPARLNHALATCYAQAAAAAGNEVRRIDLAHLDFPLLRNPEEAYSRPAPDCIREAQRDIAWADHLAIFYPIWDGDVPALLKAFIEQTFRPGFAMDYGGKRRFPKKLLTGKSGRIVVTAGMPAFLYRAAFGAHSIKGLKRSIELCGVSPVHETIIGGVGEAGERARRKWFENIAALAKYDGSRKPRAGRLALRALAAAGGAAVAAYFGFAAVTWARYGAATSREGPDELLDRVMPEYEVRMQYRIEVNASPAATFEAIRETDFQRSPIVRALFRAREILLGAQHEDRPMPRAFLDQIETLGWAIVAESPGRELVLGTVTQPWQPNPTFRALPADEFVAFHEPGYAKIAFNLRIVPAGAQTCLAQTETRVQTTDPQSRGRFRRYWAALSLGMALIRIVLLQQIKTEAESREKPELEPASSAHEVRL